MTSESPKDPIEALSGWTGRAASTPRASAPWLTRRQRITLMSLVVGGHVGLGLLLDLGSRIAPDEVDATRTTLVFLAPPEPVAPPEPPPPVPADTPRAEPSQASPRPRVPALPAGATFADPRARRGAPATTS